MLTIRLFLGTENVGGGGGHRLKIGKGGQYCLEKKVGKMAKF